MKEIVNQNFSQERALYAAKKVKLINCTFDGDEDGESPLKEACGVTAEKCIFALRYPLWHCKKVKLSDVNMTKDCRAALWYSCGVEVEQSTLDGIKAVRECDGVKISNSSIVSPEFGWKSKNLSLNHAAIESEYAFLMSQNITLDNVQFKGKYSFQYTKNLHIKNSKIDTKDAFWHARNVTVEDSVVQGEYLGWYSKNLTFINCTVKGTQPLCYCKSLQLINCVMQDTDLSFEYSDVNASINGNIVSVKNPRSGKITAGSIGDIIITADSRHKSRCKIVTDS